MSYYLVYHRRHRHPGEFEGLETWSLIGGVEADSHEHACHFVANKTRQRANYAVVEARQFATELITIEPVEDARWSDHVTDDDSASAA